jgi:hypothetical protein
MTEARVGLRRLYDAIGCALAGQEELSSTFPIGDDLEGLVYMGPKPPSGIWVTQGDKYIVPGEMSTLAKVEFHQDAGQSSYPRSFFTEIGCWFRADIPDELGDAFVRGESDARNSVLALTDGRHDELTSALDLLAGVIGLRFNRQFVMERINENPVAFVGEQRAQRGYGDALMVLQHVTLNPPGERGMSELLRAIGRSPDAGRAFGGTVLYWLMRAWAERDLIGEFIALFVPLEMVVNTHARLPAGPGRERARTIRALLRRHAGGRQDELIDFLNVLVGSHRPSLEDRFAWLASAWALPGWESHVAAFRQFNKLRNGLLHRGEARVRLHVSIGEDEVAALDDLVERYVNRALFGDDLQRPRQGKDRAADA